MSLHYGHTTVSTIQPYSNSVNLRRDTYASEDMDAIEFGMADGGATCHAKQTAKRRPDCAVITGGAKHRCYVANVGHVSLTSMIAIPCRASVLADLGGSRGE